MPKPTLAQQHSPRIIKKRGQPITICAKCKTELPDLASVCPKTGIAADVLKMLGKKPSLAP